MARLAALSVLAATAALANDSALEIGTGGIELKKLDSVSLEREDLTISSKKVEVAYVFRNHTAQDVTTEVGFPIPDYTFSMQDSQAAFADFRVEVDGKPLKFETAVTAMRGGRDLAGELKKLRVDAAHPLNAYEQLKTLPEATLEKLVALGAIVPPGGAPYDLADPRPEGPLSEWWPSWTASVTYHWKQTFKAKRTTRIRHRYTPHLGGDVMFSTGGGSVSACMDEATERALHKKNPPPKDGAAYMQSSLWVRYVLSTGANWAGPIKKFHLKVEKSSPSEVVSTCFSGLKRTSPTTLEATLDDYEPAADLAIFFYP